MVIYFSGSVTELFVLDAEDHVTAPDFVWSAKQPTVLHRTMSGKLPLRQSTKVLG